MIVDSENQTAVTAIALCDNDNCEEEYDTGVCAGSNNRYPGRLIRAALHQAKWMGDRGFRVAKSFGADRDDEEVFMWCSLQCKREWYRDYC